MTYVNAPQNKPRYSIRKRDREIATHLVWNRRDGAATGRRQVRRWGRWKTLNNDRCFSESTARELLALFKTWHPLSDVAIFFRGKRLP